MVNSTKLVLGTYGVGRWKELEESHACAVAWGKQCGVVRPVAGQNAHAKSKGLDV